MRKLFTSESVTEGHPDKICDQISDAILDAMLAQDPMSRVACETFATTGMVCIMGEITTKANVDFQSIVRETVRGIGYDRAKYGFDCDTCAVISSIHEQSPDIAMGVAKALEAKEGEMQDAYDTGAGDQGMMFGYACNETPELMPMPISLSHKLAKRLTEVRKNGMLSYLRPDGKTQVTVEYEGSTPVRVDAVVVSSQHDPEVTLEQIRADIIENVIKPIIPAEFLDDNTKIFVNPTGRFVVGGPQGDTGLTGRRSSSTPTAATHVTAAAHSPARTRPRLTVLPLTLQDTSQRTSLPQVLLTSAKWNWHMPSALQSPSPF